MKTRMFPYSALLACCLALSQKAVSSTWILHPDKCEQNDGTASPPAFALPSAEATNNAQKRHISRVPLVVSKHRLYVWAAFGRQKHKCVIDTGGYVCLWPRALNLPRSREKMKVSITDASGASLQGQGAILKQVQIGTYFLTDLPSYAHTRISKSDLLSMPVLGNEAFEDTVLTLDCHDRRMTIRQSAPPLSAACASGTVLLKFVKARSSRYIYPIVEATVERKRVRMLLDTGWTHEGIGLTSHLSAQLFPQLSSKQLHTSLTTLTFLAAKRRVKEYKQVRWALGTIHQDSNAMVVPRLPPNVEAVCGLSVFFNNRVTIDYPHGEVLLEPYKQGNSK